MIKKISDWWYNRNKPCYMLPRGKDIGEPINTMVEDFLANRSKYKVLPRGVFYIYGWVSSAYAILHKDKNLLYLLFIDEIVVIEDVIPCRFPDTHGMYEGSLVPVGYLSEDEKVYLEKLYLGMVDYYNGLETCHKEWAEKADRKRLTKVIKECL